MAGPASYRTSANESSGRPTRMLLAFVPAIATVGGYTSVTLTSGSMSPSYPAGSLLLIEHVSADQLAVGDIVSVRRPALDAVVTHRIIGLERAGDQVRVQTRGDAAPAADPGWIDAQAVEGRVVAGARAVGGLRIWFFSPLGMLVMGLLAAILVGGIDALEEAGLAGRSRRPPPTSYASEPSCARFADARSETRG